MDAFVCLLQEDMEKEAEEKPHLVEKPPQVQKPKHYIVKKVGGENNGKTRIKWLKKTVSGTQMEGQ